MAYKPSMTWIFIITSTFIPTLHIQSSHFDFLSVPCSSHSLEYSASRESHGQIFLNPPILGQMPIESYEMENEWGAT